MYIADRVLLNLGATQVFRVNQFNDPKTEEEFALLEYESPVPITWEQYQQKCPEIEEKFGTRYLRAHRDVLLQKTDWVMTADIYQSLKNKEEWVTYRQALRDITKNPPPFKWKDGGALDIDNMSLPVQPPILR
jgi:hypothetical protein